MDRSTVAPLLGSVLDGRYELVRHIARGGMGEVFEARDRLLERRVAVKLFRATGPTDRGRFDAEVRTLAALSHPALVQVYDAGEHHGDGFVVLELVDGPNLRSLIAARGALPARTVAGLGTTLADALAYIHDRGIVHRDVTPSNVLCGDDGRPRLADFGIARLLDTTRITAAATMVGTARYMAPEQVEGREVTPAADVYALGLVLHEALTGRPTFEGQGHEVAVARLLRDPDVTAGVPAAWHGVLRDMTARDPSRRPAATDLAEHLSGLGAPGAVEEAGALAGAAPPVRPDADDATQAVLVGPGVDPHAVTRSVPVADHTTVMPAALRPTAVAEQVVVDRGAARSAAARSRRAVWAALAALALAVLVGLAASDGGMEVPTTTTTTTAQVVVTAPQPTAPPTSTTVADRAREHGKAKGKRDDRR